jgi:actin-like ATPase involved in cell morphogenesis
VRGPLAHLESGAATLELTHGPVPVTALVAELLARPLRATVRELGVAPDSAVLTIPSGWPADGRRARALRAAAAIAGLPAVTLMPAAVAAAELVRDTEAVTALICDVGGRSCQLSLVELADGPARLLATTELVVGADLFDELLYLDVLRELGEHDANAAAQLEDVHLQAGATGSGADGELWAACQAGLARSVRHAREALTGGASHRLQIGAPVDHVLEIEQQRVRDLLLSELLVLAGAAREQIAQARQSGALPSGRAGHPRVLLIGGGAMTPGLRDTLEAELDLAVIADEDPATAVARGALRAVARDASAAAERARKPSSARRGSVAISQTPRSVLEDVVVATMSGGDVVAVVRHDSHHRVVRLDAAGRVRAAHGVASGPVTAVTAAPGGVVVSSAAEAAIFTTDLRQISAIERPLLTAAWNDSVWIVSAGDEANAMLDLTTLAIAGREAQVREVERLGLVASTQAARLPRRGARPAPPPALGIVAGAHLQFAVPARGRSGTPTQRVGTAGPSGLLSSDTRSGGEWVVGLAAADATSVMTLVGTGPVTLFAGQQRLAGWPEGVRVWLVGREQQAPWVVAARGSRWEALRMDGIEVVSVRAGDGTVESAGTDEDGLWLVCESGGERRLVLVTADGELHRLAALGAPLEPLGRSGAEILALAGPPGVPRTLVSITPG